MIKFNDFPNSDEKGGRPVEICFKRAGDTDKQIVSHLIVSYQSIIKALSIVIRWQSHLWALCSQRVVCKTISCRRVNRVLDMFTVKCCKGLRRELGSNAYCNSSHRQVHAERTALKVYKYHCDILIYLLAMGSLCPSNLNSRQY